MNASYDKNGAIVVLPGVSEGRLSDRSLRTWLARSDLSRKVSSAVPLARVTQELGAPYPREGLAALRMWGQTGDQPGNWIAAADPVYLEPRLDHLVLHALRRAGVATSEIRELIDHLQATLSSDDQFTFLNLESYCYLSASEPIATADVPAYVLTNENPDEYLPSGAGSAEHRKLISEIEMALHEHEVNLTREANGNLPVNSMWLWGGGKAPQQKTRPQPPLFSNDALFKGYWNSGNGLVEPWPGDIKSCIDASVAGLVVETPEFGGSTSMLETCLSDLREALQSGRLSSLTLLFRDGLRAHVRRSHSLRVWRRSHPLIDEAAQ